MLTILAWSRLPTCRIQRVRQLLEGFFGWRRGRLVRLGFTHYDNRQRRLYHFRNRHGFSDAADDAFDRLWMADGLAWSDIAALSESAVGTAA
jgi:hypothetical protein